MIKSFIKFKRRVRLQSIFSALLLGLGLGTLALAAIMLANKLAARDTDPLYYAVSAGGAVLASVIFYFVFMPSDKRLARRLDSLYSLDEKVSTMLELREEQGGFAELQRDDAEEHLSKQPKKALKSKQLIAGILALVIAIGSFVGAWMLPVKADDGEAPIDEFDKQWIITTINELITMVENSYIDDGLRGSSLTELRSLLSFVEGSELLSQMKAKAVTTVININAALKSANSAEAIAEHFLGSANENIVALGEALSELTGTESKRALEELGSDISKAETDDAYFTADEMNAYLQASGVRTDDSVYLLFKSLVAAVKSNPSSADEAFESAGKTLSSAVIVQNVNKATMTIVINKLCNLFGITENDIIAVDPDADVDLRDPTGGEQLPDDDEVEEPDGSISSGGLGTGDVIYGSNDLIFDPYTNTYRPYGEVINEYFAKANEQITDGKMSDELAEALNEYFSILFGGTKNDD